MASQHTYHLFLAFLLLSIHPIIAQSMDLKSEMNSAFKYLQNLEGVQKGQIVKGVGEVKQFLIQFGYYPTAFVDSELITDDFDDMLESALKTYQKYFHINVTGILDSDTIKEMMIPRCGMPDINHPPPNSTVNDHKFHMVAHYSFPNRKPKWPPSKYNLTYTFLSQLPFNLKVVMPICSRAFQKWAAVSPFTFKEVPVGTPSDIAIGFFRDYHGDGCPFYRGSTTIAFAYYPQDGRLHFRGDEDWSTQPNSRQSDLESFTVHEIGHILGLDHSDNTNAIMFPYINRGTIKRNLAQDDINGIQELYGNN